MKLKKEDILSTVRGTNEYAVKENHPDKPIVPEVIQTTLNKSTENRAGISVLTVVNYESLSGNIRERDFLIRRVIEHDKEFYLEGLAMDVHAPRLIRLKQVSFIQDKASGQIYSNPYHFLQEVLGIDIPSDILPEEMSDFAKAIKETGHELTVLMYLVAVDGSRSAIEREKVLEYVHKRVPYLNYKDSQMNDYLISLAPDDDSFAVAFHRVLKKGIVVVQPLMEAILQIIMADGQVHVKERALLARLIDLLKQDGYSFDIPA